MGKEIHGDRETWGRRGMGIERQGVGMERAGDREKGGWTERKI